MITHVATYPSTERQNRGFSIRYIKALMDSDAIVIHGAEVVAFATWIVSIEDRLRYQKPPTLWRADIAAKFGFRRNEATARLLKDVAGSGLVHRVPLPSGSRQEMTFWATVPDWLTPNFQPLSGSETGTGGKASGSKIGTGRGTGRGTASGTVPITYRPVDPLVENRPELRPFRRDGVG